MTLTTNINSTKLEYMGAVDEWAKDFTKIYYEDKWLYIELIEEKPWGKVFQIISKCSDIRLGFVKLYPQTGHYCYFPTIEEETIYSDRCLMSISEFIIKMNTTHKEAKH